MMKRTILLTVLLLFVTTLCLMAGAATYPESAHPYAAGLDKTWSYTHPTSAAGLRVTFSEDSDMDWSDTLTLETSDGGSFRLQSDDFAGETLVVPGKSFKLHLISEEDSDGTSYGFRVTNVEALTQAQFYDALFTVEDGVLTKYDGCVAVLSVPGTVNGETITEIGDSAFEDTDGLIQVTLPNNVTGIGEEAFYYCSDLQRVTLPKNLTYLGERAFQWCTSLESIEIPDGITELYTYTFYKCGLKSAVLPKGLTSIGWGAFCGCAELSAIEIPDSVKFIDEIAFSGAGIKSITLPKGITEINERTFENCHSLASVTFKGNVTSIGRCAFQDCGSLSGIKLPSTLNELGSSAFAGCEALTEIGIPDGITELADSTFSGCTELAKITFGASTVSLGDYSLAYCPRLSSVGTPLTGIGYRTFEGCYTLKSITFANSMPTQDESDIASLADLWNAVVTVSKNSPVLPQLKEYNVCYKVRETGETNWGTFSDYTYRDKLQAISIEMGITDSMSDYQKALLMHDWLVDNCTYKISALTLYYEPAFSLLIDDAHEGVCENFADAYHMMMDFLGIRNVKEYGSNHVWNIIQLDDGNWYHVDCTWDNTGSRSSKYFFGLSDRAVRGLNSHECYNRKVVCNSYEYNWRYRQGYLDSIIEEGYDAIMEGLEAGETEISYSYSSGYSDLDTSTAALALNDRTYTVDGERVKVSVVAGDYYRQIVATVRTSVTMDMTLPASLTKIEAEAFAGSGVKSVALGDKVKSIGARAFANCGSLKMIYIPASVTSIDATAFSGVTGLTVYGVSGSYAEEWAISKGFGFMEM